MKYDSEARKAEADRAHELADARKAEADGAHELAEAEANRAHELAMLRAQVELGVLPARNVNDFDLAKHSKLVPPFNESDPDSYFRLFEKTAAHLNWPRIQWT